MAEYNTLNGTAKALIASFVGAAAVGGVLLRGVSREQDVMWQRMAEIQIEAKEGRAVIRDEMSKQVDDLAKGRRENEVRIVALQSAMTEVETQLRAMAAVSNMERQMDAVVKELLHQCPTCKVPERRYYPPGPGPDGTAH